MRGWTKMRGWSRRILLRIWAEAGQATVEYALVIIFVVALAGILLSVGSPAMREAVGKMFSKVLGAIG
jgi:Flp pilus assembly pilin Flp